MNSEDLLLELFKNPTSKPVFNIGQKVRVISNIDVNFPPQMSFWFNTKCRVIGIIPRGLPALGS